MSVRSLALLVARSRLGAMLAGAVMRMLPAAVPGRLVTTPALVMMGHPRPMAEEHRLAVTRNGIRDVGQDHVLVNQFWSELGAWADHHHAFGTDGALVTNFGDRQEVRLLHVHVLPERPFWAAGDSEVRAETLPTAAAALRERWSGGWEGRTGSVSFTRESDEWCAHVDLAG